MKRRPNKLREQRNRIIYAISVIITLRLPTEVFLKIFTTMLLTIHQRHIESISTCSHSVSLPLMALIAYKSVHVLWSGWGDANAIFLLVLPPQINKAVHSHNSELVNLYERQQFNRFYVTIFWLNSLLSLTNKSWPIEISRSLATAWMSIQIVINVPSFARCSVTLSLSQFAHFSAPSDDCKFPIIYVVTANIIWL